MGGNMVIFWLAFSLVFIRTVQPAPKLDKEGISYFEGDEHELIGDRITLPREPGMNTILTLQNGIQVTFGQILAVAGDFYGMPGKPIIIADQPRSQALSYDTPSIADKPLTPERNEEHKKRFKAAYHTLASTPRDEIEEELNTILRMIHEDHIVRETGEGDLHTNVEFTLITGGRMLSLAAINFDHFQPQATKAYLVGHKLAMDKAREAADKTDPKEKKKMLMEAYSMDAFACHFLTDCFSSGHIRNPRVELNRKVWGRYLYVGDKLSHFMHDEDCKYGLRVKNNRGDKWIAYGDKMLMKNGNQDNLEYVLEAVQASVDQVHEAHQHPDREINTDSVTDLIPFLDRKAVNNNPLFQMKDGQLLRRNNVRDLRDTSTKSNWWGSTTLTLLARAGDEKANSVLPEP